MANNSMINIDIYKKLSDIEFHYNYAVDDFEILGVFGKSGSGKSTLLNMIAGIIKPNSGKIIINSRTIYDSSNKINIPINKRNIGFIFQENRVFPHLSVKSNLNYGIKEILGHEKNNIDIEKNDFDEVISILGVENLLDRKPYTLSGGEKSRVAIGRAILAKPELLLMDEPNASLDSDKRHELLGLYKLVTDRFNIPIIFVTHSKEELKLITQYTILIENYSVSNIISSIEL